MEIRGREKEKKKEEKKGIEEISGREEEKERKEKNRRNLGKGKRKREETGKNPHFFHFRYIFSPICHNNAKVE